VEATLACDFGGLLTSCRFRDGTASVRGVLIFQPKEPVRCDDLLEISSHGRWPTHCERAAKTSTPASPRSMSVWMCGQALVLARQCPCVYDVVYNQAQVHMSTTMTIRLDDDVKDRLDVLADATKRSKSFLAAEAIRAFVETNEWQIGEIQAALKEADAGAFASDKDVAALAKKWKVNAR
jgi:predicted transcriptional regulator